MATPVHELPVSHHIREKAMREVVIVAAGRSPIGKKNGALSAAHPTELLGQVMMEVLKRWGHESKTNNTADAYGLAALGLATKAKLGKLTLPQQAVLAALKIA